MVTLNVTNLATNEFRAIPIWLNSYNRECFIGRSSNADLVLSDSSVEPLHARIFWMNGRYEVEDLSKNGTYLNQQRLSSGQSSALSAQAILQVGNFSIDVFCFSTGIGTKKNSIWQLGQSLQSGDSPVAQSTPSALARLLAGNQRFTSNTAQHPNHSVKRLRQLIAKQSPFATIVTCADSRVVPEIMFDCGIGDLFIVRVAGNVTTSAEMATVEYGIGVLQTPLVLVLGHSNCGAVAAAISDLRSNGNIKTLVHSIRPAVNRAKGQSGEAWENAIRSNVLFQAEQVMKNKVVERLLVEQKLTIAAGYFDFATGNVSVLSHMTTPKTTIHPDYFTSY